jgi:hypothetical protein
MNLRLKLWPCNTHQLIPSLVMMHSCQQDYAVQTFVAQEITLSDITEYVPCQPLLH